MIEIRLTGVELVREIVSVRVKKAENGAVVSVEYIGCDAVGRQICASALTVLCARRKLRIQCSSENELVGEIGPFWNALGVCRHFRPKREITAVFVS